MRSEFDFIQNIKSKYGLNRVGDDCAILTKDGKTDMVVTADLLVEDIDFQLDWTTAKLLGQKALAVSLSDIAAMGANPKWSMISIGVPKGIWNGGFLDDFYEGIDLMASKFRPFGMEGIVGGDISKTPDKIVIDSIVGGEVPKGNAVRRSGAKAGDAIFVTGELGGAAAGLKLLQEGFRYPESNGPKYDSLLLKQIEPFPQISAGLSIRDGNIASAMIDLSDGLSSDLRHICEQSGTGAKIDADRIPVHRQLKRIFKSADEQFDMALNGGEDFELLFTANKKKISAANRAGFHCIGEVTANIGVIELIRDGKADILQPKGYRHF